MSYSSDSFEYSDEEDNYIDSPVSTPTIRLKLRLNTCNNDNNTKKTNNENEQEGRMQVGGKKPFALLQLQQQYQGNDYYEQEDEEDEYSDYSIDTKKLKLTHNQPLTPQPTQKPPSLPPAQSPVTTTTTTAAEVAEARVQSPAPKAKKGRKPNALLPIEKPKKRGRPTNKAKAAALLAQMPPKVPETAKKDAKSILIKLLDSIEKKDVYGFFLEPVDPTYVPDYLKIIKSPMDFSTMRQKIHNGQYKDPNDFRMDFNLVISNAKTYNAADTVYWKSADKLQESCIKMIDRAEKQIHEIDLEVLTPVKQEDMDVIDLDISRKQPETRETSIDSRAVTPIKTSIYKKKKKKTADMGVLYGPDGSLHTVGDVHDLESLLPFDPPFSHPPQMVITNPLALPSAFFSNRYSADDFYQHKHISRSANHSDYGPFPTLGVQPPGAFYTTLDASYIYPIYGDDRGEAYMKSLWDFVDQDQDLQDLIQRKSNHLTRGAWSVIQQSLERKNENLESISFHHHQPVLTEFGPVEAAKFVDKIEAKLK